ncbi:MAG: zinc ABC transporter substrate-binding protein, partial [Clostridia bacterium]|nr:zinc ABC transporter substrate-binding protein [Clostridia bacterium]
MNTSKKIISLLLLLCLLATMVVSCAGISDSDGISIVSTIFAPFDFARAIAGERASVKMLLQPGSDSHSYDPTPKDMIAISKCDIFIYTGSEADAWVEEILSAASNPDMKVI